MKIILIFLLIPAFALAGLREDYARDAVRISALLKESDRLVFTPDPYVSENIDNSFTLEGKAIVARAIRGLRISDEILKEIFEVDGEEIYFSPPCQCSGQGDLKIFRGDRLLLSARIHHWKELLVELEDGEIIILDLLPDAHEFQRMLNFLFPDPEANQSVQTRSTSHAKMAYEYSSSGCSRLT